MKRVLTLLLMVFATYAQIDVKPYVKSEALINQMFDTTSETQVFLGETRLGMTAKTGNVSATVTGDFTVDSFSLWESYVSVGVGKIITLKAGKKVVPFGDYGTNLVNYPYAKNGSLTKTGYKQSTFGAYIESRLPGDFYAEYGGYRTVNDSAYEMVGRISWNNETVKTSVAVKNTAIVGNYSVFIANKIEPFIEVVKDFDSNKFAGQLEVSYYTKKATALSVGANVIGNVDNFDARVGIGAMKPLSDNCVIGVEIYDEMPTSNKHIESHNKGIIGLVSFEL